MLSGFILAIPLTLNLIYQLIKLSKSIKNYWINITIKKILVPIIFLLAIFLLVVLEKLIDPYLAAALQDKWKTILFFMTMATKSAMLIFSLWIIWSVINTFEGYVENVSQKKIVKILVPMLVKCLKISIVFIIFSILVSELGILDFPKNFLEKFFIISLMGIFLYIIYKSVNFIEKVIIFQYTAYNDDFASLRKIKTLLSILKSIILIIAIFILLSSVLLMFDSVKNVGAGLLTTAGIVSAAGAFASQKSLARIFAGLQIAFTQPIKMGDAVMIDNEFGEVEEISLSYVVIKLWDLRRLILPTDYITANKLLNLSRSSTQLLGTVFFYVDHTLPIDRIREEFVKTLSLSRYWDKSVHAFHVSDMKEFTVELRAVISASSPENLWEVRCEIREAIIKFIAVNYASSLPCLRVEHHHVKA